MTTIRQDDFIQSIADAFQFISYYHPLDYIKALGAAYEREESPAAKDAIAQILTNSRMSAEGHRPICQDTGIALVFLKVGMQVQWDTTLSVQQMVDEFARRAEFMLTVAPEGTRGKAKKWRTGFYQIAMAAKVPIIATRVGAIPEIIEDRKNGIIVPSKNPEAIAGAIEELSQDDRLRQELAIQAHQNLIKNFSANQMVEKYEELFGTLELALEGETIVKALREARGGARPIE